MSSKFPFNLSPVPKNSLSICGTWPNLIFRFFGMNLNWFQAAFQWCKVNVLGMYVEGSIKLNKNFSLHFSTVKWTTTELPAVVFGYPTASQKYSPPCSVWMLGISKRPAMSRAPGGSGRLLRRLHWTLARIGPSSRHWKTTSRPISNRSRNSMLIFDYRHDKSLLAYDNMFPWIELFFVRTILKLNMQNLFRCRLVAS